MSRICLPLLLAPLLSAQEPPAPGAGHELLIPRSTSPDRSSYALSERVRFGGYADLEFRADGSEDTFRAHRIVPFLHGEIDENISFAAELEIEDGEDLSIEFAHIDYRVSQVFGFRAGILLTPLGRLNLYHDSPIQELTDRPLVTRTVIPTTLREPGFGFFGEWEGGEDFRLEYQVYATSGFKGLDALGNTTMSTSGGLRDARASKGGGGTSPYRDNNDSVAFVGRLAVHGRLSGISTELGGSLHTGNYDENGDNRLTIAAVDGTLHWDNLELLAEYAYADVDRDGFALTSGVPGDMWGYYLQAGYKVFPGFLDQWVEKGTVGEGAHVTFLLRYGETDLDGALKDRLTVGMNFRPNRSRTVFKIEYQWNDEHGSQGFLDNDGFIASVATYF